jgi:hypothetical protein
VMSPAGVMSEGLPSASRASETHFRHPDDAAVFLQATLFANVVVDFIDRHLVVEPGKAGNIAKGLIYREKTTPRVCGQHAAGRVCEGSSEAFRAGTQIQTSLFRLGDQAARNPSFVCQCYVRCKRANDVTIWLEYLI